MKKNISLILLFGTLLPLRSEDKWITEHLKVHPRFELPRSAEKLLIERVHAKSIVGVGGMTYRRHGSFDYLGVSMEFEIDWGSEGVYYQTLVLRKKTTQTEWSDAELFDTQQNIFHLFAENEESDLLKGLVPRKEVSIDPVNPPSGIPDVGGKFMDDKLAANAEVVLRVKRLTAGEGSKYLWSTVEVLQVLKNTSGETFTNRLSVAAYSGKEGVPEGESTLYLERYNPTDKGLWKLVGGEASTGVSHVKKP